MDYRVLPHGGEKISVIGMGMGSIHNSTAAETERIVRAALDAGVNYFDFVPSKAVAFEGYARALKGQRNRAMLQVHLGADYSSGEYGWTINPKRSIAEFEARLKLLGTDYADFGFVHCIDELDDLDKVMNGKAGQWLLKKHADGTIRHLGFSTHRVEVAQKLIDTGLMDMGMFSMNPMYDYTNESSYGRSESAERARLYRSFEAHGVGISVMKPYAGGQLLSASASPFGHALTVTQCIQYVLDKPGVLTVLPGIRTMQDLDDALAYLDATSDQRDYSIIGTFAPASDKGACVYCNHCQPCPQGLLIGAINKYYDLARMGDALAAEHYANLSAHASDCTHCQHCNSRCPFGVDQSNRMDEIASYFGR